MDEISYADTGTGYFKEKGFLRHMGTELHEMRRGLKNTEQEMGECTESGILWIKELESLSSVLR